MCGINGFFNYSGKVIANPEELIKKMNQRIAHRGPDDSGIWHNTDRTVYLGHQRLSILDPSPAGHQPMTSPKTGNTIVYNGEVYNFKELRKSLSGFTYRSESDTETLLELYGRKGTECIHDLNGMFAFAVWNEQKETLFLARDRIGQKPLYYTTMGGVFAFSSEIKALLELPWVTAEPDEEALYHFLTFNQLPPPQTMFKNISKFHPGHSMVVNTGGIQSYDPYWEVQRETIDPLEAEHMLYEKLEHSVKRRMLSDVPVGAFLSGGVDSSAIVGMMSQSTDTTVKTFSIGFEGQPEFDERSHAHSVSKLFGTEHFDKVVNADHIREFLPNVVRSFDEPLADSTCIPIYFLSEMARKEGIKVVMTGDGADELFFGYNNWMKYLKLYPLYEQYSRLPKMIKTPMAKMAQHLDSGSPKADMLHRAAMGEEFFWGGAKSFKESAKRDLLNTGFLKKVSNLNSYSIVREYKQQYEKSLGNTFKYSSADWMTYMGLKFIIPDLYLSRMDRLGMANSVEVRTPFLDHELVNLALSIPYELKVKDGEPKYVLKKALEKLLPNEVLYRKKKGFCVPLQEWASDVMFDYIDQNFNEFCSNTAIFDEKKLGVHVGQIKAGKSARTNDAWTIYFLMKWFEEWM